MTYLLFGGGLYMVLMAFVWLVQPARNAINYYFAAMYSSSGFIVLYAWAERTGFVYGAYPIYDIQIPLCYAFAPLLYYGFSQVAELNRKPAKPYPLHFVPAVVSLPLVVANNLLHPGLFANLPAESAQQVLLGHPSFFALHLLGLGSNLYILFFLFRIIAAGLSLFRDRALESMKELRYLLLYVAMFILDILVMMVAHFTKNRDLLHFAKLMSSITFILYSFYSFRYPEYTQKIIRKARQVRYKNTQLRGIDTDELLSRLDYLMESEKIFKDIELSLESMSAQLMVTPHQLSEILNDRLRVNFRTYLSGHRVREAEKLLRERPEASIIEVAFDVGFNSKASFNEHFLKRTGVTPSEYRRNGELGRPADADSLLTP